MEEGENRFELAGKRFEDWLNSEEYQEKLDLRLRLNSAATDGKDAKLNQIQLFKLCADDPIFFIENFGWTFDPRPEHWINGTGHLPFVMFDYQKEAVMWLVKHIREGEDGLIEKSRDMGVTWLVVWVFLWFWRFTDTFSGLLGSYKEALVDNRTKDSLFGMLDYAYTSLPKWIQPKGFKAKEHRQAMKLINPENFNLISGDTMNPDFARGSRKTAVVLDEGASWAYFREAWESAGDTTPCRLTVSTPKGRNAFSKLRESGIDVLRLHWRSHPLKDDNWYQFEKSRRTDEEVAQELDISYQKSQEGRVYPEWDNVEVGDFPYDPSLPVFVSWDFGHTDDTAMIWWQTEPSGRVHIIDSYTNHGKTIDFYVPFVTGILPSESIGYTKRDFDVIESHRHWKRGIHFGDPAGRFTQQVTNQSVMDILRQYGIHVNFREDAQDFPTRKTQTKLLLRNLVVNKNSRTEELCASMENARYPKVRTGGDEEIRSIKPVHDFTSHYRSAVEYFAVNYNLRATVRRARDKFPVRSSGRSVHY